VGRALSGLRSSGGLLREDRSARQEPRGGRDPPSSDRDRCGTLAPCFASAPRRACDGISTVVLSPPPPPSLWRCFGWLAIQPGASPSRPARAAHLLAGRCRREPRARALRNYACNQLQSRARRRMRALRRRDARSAEVSLDGAAGRAVVTLAASTRLVSRATSPDALGLRDGELLAGARRRLVLLRPYAHSPSRSACSSGLRRPTSIICNLAARLSLARAANALDSAVGGAHRALHHRLSALAGDRPRAIVPVFRPSCRERACSRDLRIAPRRRRRASSSSACATSRRTAARGTAALPPPAPAPAQRVRRAAPLARTSRRVRCRCRGGGRSRLSLPVQPGDRQRTRLVTICRCDPTRAGCDGALRLCVRSRCFLPYSLFLRGPAALTSASLLRPSYRLRCESRAGRPRARLWGRLFEPLRSPLLSAQRGPVTSLSTTSLVRARQRSSLLAHLLRSPGPAAAASSSTTHPHRSRRSTPPLVAYSRRPALRRPVVGADRPPRGLRAAEVRESCPGWVRTDAPPGWNATLQTRDRGQPFFFFESSWPLHGGAARRAVPPASRTSRAAHRALGDATQACSPPRRSPARVDLDCSRRCPSSRPVCAALHRCGARARRWSARARSRRTLRLLLHALIR